MDTHRGFGFTLWLGQANVQELVINEFIEADCDGTRFYLPEIPDPSICGIDDSETWVEVEPNNLVFHMIDEKEERREVIVPHYLDTGAVYWRMKRNLKYLRSEVPVRVSHRRNSTNPECMYRDRICNRILDKIASKCEKFISLLSSLPSRASRRSHGETARLLGYE